MRVLLTGRNGQIGFELRRAFAPFGEVISVDRTRCDLSRPEGLRELVRHVRPQVILNAAAYTAVDRAEAEPDLARAVNATAPGILGEEAANLGALLVHYSTDYVFDGTKTAAYTESDAPNPQSVYGSTKLAGERAIEKSGARYLIFRTSWVFGHHGMNFAKTMLTLASERDSLAVVNDQFGAPTSSALLADITAHIVRDAAREPERFPYGLYHVASGGHTTWYRYATYVIEKAREAGLPIRVRSETIRSITTEEYPTAAARPSNSRLDTKRLCSTFGLEMPDWAESLDHTLEQIFRS
jgi:dTDP-4-dehydrorhamnose reductase